MNRLKRNSHNLAKLAGLFAGVTFGIYWLILRQLALSGLPGAWAVAGFNLVLLALFLPGFALWRSAPLPTRRHFHVCTFLLGLAYVLYSSAFLYTQVIKVVGLFYLMPLWGFVFARLVLGERITPIRWLSMVLGLAGIAVMFGFEAVPQLRNIGDWMAFFSGIFWALGSLMLLTDRQDTLNHTLGFLFWGSVLGLALALFAWQYAAAPLPDFRRFGGVLPWLLPLGVCVLIPGLIATVYAPSKLNPGVVGLLFMTEVSVAAITAALFADEPFGYRELLAVGLITLAGLSEPAIGLLRRLLPARGRKPSGRPSDKPSDRPSD